MRRLIIFLLILFYAPNCWALQKNVASQKWIVFAFDITDNSAKTGDAAQITANLRIDGVQNAVDDTNPTELEDGYYEFDITAAESNGDNILIAPASSTGSIQVIGAPMALWTTPPYFPAMSIDSNGRLDIIKVAGTTQTANDNSADINTIVTAVGNIETDTAAQDTAGEWDGLMATVLGYTDDIGVAGVGLAEAGGDGDHLTAINLPNQTMDIIGNITGNLSGSVGSNLTIDTVAECKTLIFGWLMTDLDAGAPDYNATVAKALNYLYEAWRNGYRTDGTNSEIVLYKDDGTTPLVEADIADDGTDFTRQEYGAPD